MRVVWGGVGELLGKVPEKSKAQENGKEIHLSSVQMVPSNGVCHGMTHRDLYSFAEISQNNQDSKGGRGRAHWENVMQWRNIIVADAMGPMPMNNEKIYGSREGNNYLAGTRKEEEDRQWKNVFSGAASVRFHRSEGTWGYPERSSPSALSCAFCKL